MRVIEDHRPCDCLFVPGGRNVGTGNDSSLGFKTRPPGMRRLGKQALEDFLAIHARPSMALFRMMLSPCQFSIARGLLSPAWDFHDRLTGIDVLP
jgi:hypothetical protein